MIDARDVARLYVLLTSIRSTITKDIAGSDSVRDAWIRDDASSVQRARLLGEIDRTG